MTRPRPSSTLFPYTTLFRSASATMTPPSTSPCPARYFVALWRSEEHTSELQSRSDLVCRLLLEKKISGAALGRHLRCSVLPHGLRSGGPLRALLFPPVHDLS